MEKDNAILTKEEIRDKKLGFRNKVKKAERCCNSQVEDYVGQVNLDFVSECVDLHRDLKSVSKDYLDLYNFMITLDRSRVAVYKDRLNSLKKDLNASERDNRSLDYDNLLLMYQELLKRNKELVAENNELLEFKKKFTRSKKVDDSMIVDVNNLSMQGLSTRAIAQVLNLSNCTVSKILNNKY